MLRSPDCFRIADHNYICKLRTVETFAHGPKFCRLNRTVDPWQPGEALGSDLLAHEQHICAGKTQDRGRNQGGQLRPDY